MQTAVGLTPAQETSLRRRETMRAGLDVGVLSGLEIGPLADPIVRKSEGDVRYVDHADAHVLRGAYADDGRVDAQAIVDIDAVWGEQSLSDCLSGGTVDYVMASHVAEHVPDLTTWLDEVRSVLRPGGQLRLALPDWRFSHDALRDETRLVDLLAAWVLRARRPQVRDVLDFRLHVAPTIDARTIYDGTADLSLVAPQHSFEQAVEAAGWARDLPDHYFDVHCWVAQPKTFARLMQGLAGHGLLRLACAGMVDTSPPIWEYYAFLTPCDDRAEVVRSWREVQAMLHDPLPASAAGRRVIEAAQARAAEAARLESLAREYAEARRARQAAETALAGASAQLETARARVDALERSLSWRVTAPLRRLRASLR